MCPNAFLLYLWKYYHLTSAFTRQSGKYDLGGVVCFLGNNEWKLCSLQSQLKPKLLPAWDSIQYAAPLDQKPCDLLWIALKSLGRAKAKLILHRNSASQ